MGASALWAALLMAGCARPAPSQPEDLLVLEVAPETVPCVGEAPGRCLRIREPGAENWLTFHGVIQGFRHEDGVGYTLEVTRRRVPNPPADGSGVEYRLARILERRSGGGPG